jgi:hypothetical protein
MPRPNLLFLYTDEQAARTMAAYGNDLIDTPNLDRLANESLVFERTYVTQPVCTPSRSGWKFNCSPIGEHELYNVADDPGETENLFEHESVRELVADLYTRLLDWQEQTGDEARLASDPRLD